MPISKKAPKKISRAKKIYVLTLNIGSSSIKYKVFRVVKATKVPELEEVAGANFERVLNKQKRSDIISFIAKELKRMDISPSLIAHRIVHGGDINKPTLVTPRVIKKLRVVAELAPLHDIPEIEGIEFCQKLFKAKNIAIFDTMFHQTMPEKAKLYGLPYKYYKQGIKRYGFHGISVSYVTRGMKGKVIVCHLGSGASITAVKNGKSVDTSMGFTPLEGLLMGTRSGSLDPSILPYLTHHQKLSIEKVENMLNKESGILGISGISNDLRDILSSHKPQAILALDTFIYRIIKQIGAYAAAMDGVDSIVFCAGIGEGSAYVRKRIISHLSHLGAILDTKKNTSKKEQIHARGSKVKLFVKKTNEEKEMAIEAFPFLKK